MTQKKLNFITQQYPFFPPDSITINYKDSRWVGAWWLGFILTGTVILLSSIPFFFLPKSLPKQGEENSNKSTELAHEPEQEHFLSDETQDDEEKEKKATFKEMAKGNSLFRLAQKPYDKIKIK